MTRRHLALALLIIPAVTRGQAAPPDDSASPPPEGALAPRYVDGSFGFAIRPPAGCDRIREKRFVGAADVELVRFVKPSSRWALTVRQSNTTRPLDADLIVEGITRELESRFSDVKVVRKEETRIASREGVRCAATLVAQGVDLLRQQAVIRTKPTEYIALVFVTPTRDRDVATPLFDKIVESFEILRSEKTAEQIQRGLTRGTELLQSVKTRELDLLGVVRDEIFLRCIINGKEEGFMQIREEVTTMGHRKGIAVHKWGWLFKPAKGDPLGTVTHMRHYMFLARDLSHEKWENRLMVLAPDPDRAGREAALTIENAVRQDDKLLIRYTPKPNAPELTEKAIEVESSYASAPWDVFMPRLVDLSRPELYVFSTYDTGRRGLVMRALRVVGPENVRIEGRTVPAVKLEDSEGLIPPVHEIYVDEKGRLLRVVIRIPDSSMEMIATTRDYIERTYEARIKQVEALFQQHPVKEPPPAGKKPR